MIQSNTKKIMSIIFIRLTPFIAPFLIFIGFELIIIKPKLLGFVAPFILAIILVAVFLVSTREVNKKFWRFVLSPFLFTFSSLLFFSFLTVKSGLIKQAILLVIIFGLGIILENIFKYFYDKAYFFNYSLENVFRYTNILTLFFFFTGVYSMNIFFGFPVWVLLFLVFLIVFALSYQQYWLTEVFKNSDSLYNNAGIIDRKIIQLMVENKVKFRIYILVPTLALLEVFWATSFFPTSFYVNSFLLTVTYYGIMSIIRARLHHNLNKKTVRQTFIWVSVALLVTLFTARW